MKELQALDNDFRDLVANAKRDVIVFGDRFPFRYFCEEYGIKYYAAFPGCSGLTEAGASTVAFLINKVTELEVPCVFITELSKGLIGKTIADAASGDGKTVSVLELHSCHNLSADDFNSGATYISLMKRNLENLKIALN